ncbi:MAG: hypothetical protein WAK82_32805 [Streptosporangiaceae bacterium]
MMHVRFSLVAADPQVLAGCIEYLRDEARPVVESQRGSLGLALLEQPGVAVFESFWATQEALWLSRDTEAVFQAELARRVKRPVPAEDYQVAAFEREGPPGEAIRLTRMQVKPAGVPDVVDVYGDTAVPWLVDTLGFRETLLFADPADGQLISQTGWQTPAARAASPSVAEMIQAEVLAEDDCQVSAVEDYRLVFDSARKPGPAWW